MSLGRPLSLALLVATTLVYADVVDSHPNHGPSLGERYFKLDVREDSVRVVYGLTYSARHGDGVRRDADKNRDGQIDETEARGLGEVYRQKVSSDVTLSIGGQPKQLTWSQPYLGQVAGPIGPGIVTIELTAEAELGTGAQVILLDDRAEFTGIYRSTATTSIAPEVELTKSGRGAEPRGRERRIVYMDLPSPEAPPSRIFSVAAVLPGVPEATETNGGNLPLVGGLLLSLLLLVAAGYKIVSARGKGSPEP